MKTLISFLLICSLLVSCSARKQTLPSVATDINTSDTIMPGSILLEKGKVYITYVPAGNNNLLGKEIFNKSVAADFTTRNPVKDPFKGGKSSRSGIDTVFTSNLLTNAALYALMDRIPPGIEYIIVDPGEWLDAEGRFNSALFIERYNPDILITVSDLTFTIRGNASSSGVFQRSMNGPDSYSEGTVTTYSGDIFITYTAFWSISGKGRQEKQVKQTGQIYSKYEKEYDLSKELFRCAKYAGTNFSTLLRRAPTK